MQILHILQVCLSEILLIEALFVGQLVCPSIRLSVRPSIHPSIHLSVHPSVHLSIRPSIHPSVCLPLLNTSELTVAFFSSFLNFFFKENFFKMKSGQMYYGLARFEPLLGFFWAFLMFFTSNEPISAKKVPIYAIFSKNPNRIFSDMPRADVWGLGMDSRQSAMVRHFFWGGSTRGMRGGLSWWSTHEMSR